MQLKRIKGNQLLISTAGLALVVVAAKLIIELFGWEFINISPLFTSIIAGGIFILSILLSGVLADYKESDRLPAEMAASIAAIYEEGAYVKRLHNKFDLASLRKQLQKLIKAFPTANDARQNEKAYTLVDGLSSSFVEMEQLGVPPNYIVRLKQEQAALRKALLRIHHIQRTQFLPSASRLAETITVLIISLLLLARIEPVVDGLLLTAFVSYIFIFLIKLLHVAETPFRERGGSKDDVSLFLLRDLHKRISNRS